MVFIADVLANLCVAYVIQATRAIVLPTAVVVISFAILLSIIFRVKLEQGD
jgi:hypothetical protein